MLGANAFFNSRMCVMNMSISIDRYLIELREPGTTTNAVKWKELSVD